MSHIKHTFQLWRLDWRRILKNPLATGLIIALMVIPSLYAWFNIKALWDPYANTSELPIAVYSADTGSEFQNQKVQIGDEVIKNLHKNKQLGWRFVDSKKDLVEGVKSGKYYAGIYLPKEFSADLLSFTSGDIKKPQIEYYINEKINAIAPKIADKGAASLQDQITDQFINTAADTLLTVFNTIGYNLDENMVSINKIKDLILKTDANLDTIDGYTQEILTVQAKMPELKDKLAKAQALKAYLPEVDKMGTQLAELNKKMPELQKDASMILTLQQKIPEIQNAGSQIAMVDSDFDDIEKTMNDGISEAKDGLTIIQQVHGILPQLQQFETNADQFASAAKDGGEKLQAALPQIANSAEIILSNIQPAANQIDSWAQQASSDVDKDLTPEKKEHLKAVLQDFYADLDWQLKGLDGLITILNKLPDAANNETVQTIISRLTNLKNLQTDLQNKIQDLTNKIDSLDAQQIRDFLNEISSISGEVANVAGSIDPTAISNTLNDLLNQMLTTITDAQGLLSKAQAVDLDSLLTNTEGTVSSAIQILEKYQKEMPAIKQEIHDANSMLNGHMDQIVNGINKGADLYNNDLPVAAEKLTKANDFMANDWPGVKQDITKGLDIADQKMPELESGLNMAADMINNDWPTLKSGIQKSADAIRKGEETVDLGEVIKLLKVDAQKESDFFTKPVELKTNKIYPIANNGSASAPFYTALCLWVGAVLFASVTTTSFTLEEKDRKKYSKREQFAARGLTYLTVGVAQALIVTLGNIFLLGVDVKAAVLSVLFGILIGLTFTMMVYVLVALFGTIGKGLAVIILVLSISGGGGNYPIQVSGKFFQAINPFLPFTYAVDLLRETAGGIYWPNAMHYLVILVILFFAFAVIGTWAYPLMEPVMARLTKAAHKSEIFH